MDQAATSSAKEMFELVGRALFYAQLMEKELAFLLLFPTISAKHKLPTADECSQMIRKMDLMTFGTL
jgi:hypothetical protein